MTTNQSDRELLELAAKAAGINVQQWVESRNTFFLEPHQQHWNPLTDDGDALRLAVKLGLFIDAYAPATTVGNVVDQNSLACKTRMEDHHDDPYAATRRAIVRAAAEIGGQP